MDNGIDAMRTVIQMKTTDEAADNTPDADQPKYWIDRFRLTYLDNDILISLSGWLTDRHIDAVNALIAR